MNWDPFLKVSVRCVFVRMDPHSYTETVHWHVNSKVRSKVSFAALGELHRIGGCRDRLLFVPSMALQACESLSLTPHIMHSPLPVEKTLGRRWAPGILKLADFSFLPLWLVGWQLCVLDVHIPGLRQDRWISPSRTFSRNWRLGFPLALVWLYSYGVTCRPCYPE